MPQTRDAVRRPASNATRYRPSAAQRVQLANAPRDARQRQLVIGSSPLCPQPLYRDDQCTSRFPEWSRGDEAADAGTQLGRVVVCRPRRKAMGSSPPGRRSSRTDGRPAARMPNLFGDAVADRHAAHLKARLGFLVIPHPPNDLKS